MRKESCRAAPAAGDWSDGVQSAPSKSVVVWSSAPWGRWRETAEWRWSYEHPFGRTWPFLAPMIPYRCLYGYFCQTPLVLSQDDFFCSHRKPKKTSNLGFVAKITCDKMN